jgi:DNA-directed RNA polymerase sigma subunit (sigma70/sigma32)
MAGRTSRPDQVDRYVAMTLREIAAVMGVTPQRVMQIERKRYRRFGKRCCGKGLLQWKDGI